MTHVLVPQPPVGVFFLNWKIKQMNAIKDEAGTHAAPNKKKYLEFVFWKPQWDHEKGATWA